MGIYVLKMNIIYREETLIFDGSSNNFEGAIKEINFAAVSYKAELKSLKSIAQLPNYYKNLDPDEISQSLGLNVTSFDGIKIYNGSKRGLKLYYQAERGNEKDILLIFSFGELQPGRIMCLFEAAFSL